jgi:hypothetical protein
MKALMVLSEGNIVVEVKEVNSNVINIVDGVEQLFTDLDNHYEIDNYDDNILGNKYDPSTQTYTAPGVDLEGNPRWFDVTTGVLWQHTYEEDGRTSMPEEVV